MDSVIKILKSDNFNHWYSEYTIRKYIYRIVNDSNTHNRVGHNEQAQI